MRRTKGENETEKRRKWHWLSRPMTSKCPALACCYARVSKQRIIGRGIMHSGRGDISCRILFRMISRLILISERMHEMVRWAYLSRIFRITTWKCVLEKKLQSARHNNKDNVNLFILYGGKKWMEKWNQLVTWHVCFRTWIRALLPPASLLQLRLWIF